MSVSQRNKLRALLAQDSQPETSIGGGGGGVLVNGAGPDEWVNTQGQGYGGGASGTNDVYIGLRGGILLEMVT